jgi:uncharacterized OsmC-like protein
MTANTTSRRYTVNAHTTDDGVAEVTANNATMTFDRSWPNTEQPSLPGPGELLAAAFAACAIKNVERFSQILPFAYDSAEIDVELHRNDHPPRFDRIGYVLRIVTDEPDARVDLLARNLAKHGTVYNTLAAGCEISGRIETTPTSNAVETTPVWSRRSDSDGPISS